MSSSTRARATAAAPASRIPRSSRSVRIVVQASSPSVDIPRPSLRELELRVLGWQRALGEERVDASRIGFQELDRPRIRGQERSLRGAAQPDRPVLDVAAQLARTEQLGQIAARLASRDVHLKEELIG